MDIITLSSGSAGNCTLIRSAGTTVLVDIGISCRRAANFLKEVGIAPEEISAILVTHEHSDHIKGVPLFSKKYGVRVAAIKDLWANELCQVQQELRINLKRRMQLDGIEIETFETAHDTIYPVGFVFFDGKEKAGVATDTGYVTQAMASSLEEVDMLVIEANHDVEMLQTGSYPFYLKKRILSKQGHLSNVDCGEFLAHTVNKSSKIILAHLSEENNSPKTAYNTVLKKLIYKGKENFCKVSVAPRLAPGVY